MCSEAKCCCLKLETGTLIFGVIASVFNALLILAAIGGIFAFNVIITSQSPPTESYDYDFGGRRIGIHYSEPPRYRVPEEAIIGGNVGLVFAFLKSVMDFTFSVLLCNGANKRNPSHLKAYFIYGIVMAVLYSIAVVVLALIVEAVIIGVVGTVGIILYGLILHMINLTRAKMLASSGEVYGFEHKRLQDAVY